MVNRTICCLTLSLLMGILYGRTKSLWFASLLLLFLIYIGIVVAGRCKEKVWRVIAIRSILSILLFCLGSMHVQAELSVRDRVENAFTKGEQITVSGEVYRTEEKTEQFIYYLRNTHVLVGGTAYPCYGIQVYSSNAEFYPGNIIKITGIYAPFQISRNEGNFNEKQYYQSKKIEFRVYAEEEILVSSKRDQYMFILGNLRQKLKNIFVECMTEKDAGIMANITLGDKSLLDPEIKSLYQDAGISHILAISGLHVSLFGMGIFRLMQKLRCPRVLCALLAIGTVYSFGLLSGMEISTVRAVCMFVLLMVSEMSGYSYDSVTAMAVSTSIQMWDNPFVIEYAGFLFSYGAVIGVTIVAKVIKQENFFGKSSRNEEDRTGREMQTLRKKMLMLWEKLRSTMFASICIQLTTLPLSFYYYYEMPCYSIITNACILPFLGVLLSLGILGAFMGTVSIAFGRLILMPAGWILDFNEWLCRKFLRLPGAVLVTGKPELSIILLYYGILCIILYLLSYIGKTNRMEVDNRKRSGRGESNRKSDGTKKYGTKKYIAGIAAVLIMLIFVREKKQFEIDILDVGQGDGIFIQGEEGNHFFIDGGSSDIKKVGKYRILPFLKSRGIWSIKGWIVSHADSDHISGLKELLEEGYPVETLIVAKVIDQDEAGKDLLNIASESGCKILYVTPGMQFGTENMRFTVLHPGEEEEQLENSEIDRNGMSLVVSLEYHGFTGVFTGDIGEESEQELLKKKCIETYGMKNVDFYKAAHHGSNGSNCQEFLDAVSPKVTAISCGEGNSYGHPGEDAVERIKKAGSLIFCTMDTGQIKVRLEGKDMKVSGFLHF